MIKKMLLALALVASLLFVVVPKSEAATYYGTVEIYTTSGWMGNNPYYDIMSATNHPAPLQVYNISPSVFGFYDPGHGYEYTNNVGSGPCGPWFCNDAGALVNEGYYEGWYSGYYIIRCEAGHPGWFSIWSQQTKEWAVLVWVSGGYSWWFGYGRDPRTLAFPNGGVFYSTGAFCR